MRSLIKLKEPLFVSSVSTISARTRFVWKRSLKRSQSELCSGFSGDPVSTVTTVSIESTETGFRLRYS